MKIPNFITRKFLQEHRELIFVFGDNLEQTGLGGQAAECRGESNAFGVPTKYRPSTQDAAFFIDNNYKYNCDKIDEAISRIPRDGRKIIIFPGIGTGLAEMPQRCPGTYKYLCQKLKELIQQ